MSVIKTIIKLRRNNLYNYEKYQDSFIPENGELCLIDTPKSGLRVKCGDGVSTFSELPYVDTILYKGYLFDGVFYKDPQHTQPYEENINKIYADLAKAKLYIYDNGAYQSVSTDAPYATVEVPGIMKLYKSTGQNEDGTMTQKSITDEIDKKMSAKVEGELISFV